MQPAKVEEFGGMRLLTINVAEKAEESVKLFLGSFMKSDISIARVYIEKGRSKTNVKR